MVAVHDAVYQRGDSKWRNAVVLSFLVHVLLLLSLDQLPISKSRLVEREILLTVDLAPLPEAVVIEESPPEEYGELREPPPTNLLDMRVAAALPEPGVDLFEELPEPMLDPTEEMPLLSSDPLELPMDERDLLSAEDKLSTLSLHDEFKPTLPADKMDALTKRDALLLGRSTRDDLAPAPTGPAATTRRVGYETKNPADHTSGVERGRLRPPGASRSYATPGKGSLGPPREGRPTTRERKRRRIRTVKPVVPRWVEEKGIETYAKVRIQILESGKIGTVVLTMSSGERELDHLALGAVKQWLYDPGLVEYRLVKINFKLE